MLRGAYLLMNLIGQFIIVPLSLVALLTGACPVIRNRMGFVPLLLGSGEIHTDNGLALTGWQMLIGSFPVLGLSFLFERNLPVKWSLLFISVLLGLALIGSALTTILWAWLLQKYQASTLSVYLFLTPVFALGTAYAAFHEALDPFELSGIGFILAGIALELLRPKPPAQ